VMPKCYSTTVESVVSTTDINIRTRRYVWSKRSVNGVELYVRIHQVYGAYLLTVPFRFINHSMRLRMSSMSVVWLCST